MPKHTSDSWADQIAKILMMCQVEGMTKHTPGPWAIHNGVQIRSERDQIAKVWMMRQGEGKANATLIAAAPELLKALKTLVHEVSSHLGSLDAFEDEINAAVAVIVIVKAEGIEENLVTNLSTRFANANVYVDENLEGEK